MDFDKMIEKTMGTERIYEGSVINLRIDTVTMPNGNLARREIVEHPGGVGVLPIDGDGNVYMVRQYRHPYKTISLEIPAGKLNRGEGHFECGRRELEEETGYKAGSFEYLGEFHPTPGFCDEKLHIYLATDLSVGTLNPDEDEFLNVEAYKLDDLVDMVMRGEIHDAKTVVAIMIAKRKLG